MVIKDEKGKVVILLDQDDIIKYVFEKCGFEVGIAIEDMTKEPEESDEDDLEFDLREAEETNTRLESENEDLNRKVEDLEENNTTLERINKELLDKQKIQKNIYIEYLKSQGLEFAAKKLKEFDE